eukprot:jgi/Picsp_1/3004/NSC_01226-R1_---NA---
MYYGDEMDERVEGVDSVSEFSREREREREREISIELSAMATRFKAEISATPQEIHFSFIIF